MPDDTATSGPPEHQHFRRRWFRLVIPSAFAIGMFGFFVYRIPDAAWVAITGLCFSLMLCAGLHGGLILSREGIEWYILRPKWVFRRIPWSAVLDVRKGLFGLPRIRLIVESGRYEPWVWGTPRRDRPRDVMIHTRDLARGEEVWAAIQDFWSRRDRAADGEAAG